MTGAGAVAALLLPGCSPVSVVKAPFQVAGKATDWATTSGEEADRNRGRRLREKCKLRYDPYYCER